MLACFTRGKLLNSSTFLLMAVWAAIVDELESGMAKLLWEENLSMLPCTRSSATSLARTRKILDDSEQNCAGDSSVPGPRSRATSSVTAAGSCPVQTDVS